MNKALLKTIAENPLLGGVAIGRGGFTSAGHTQRFPFDAEPTPPAAPLQGGELKTSFKSFFKNPHKNSFLKRLLQGF
jgi:hypothetical protein